MTTKNKLKVIEKSKADQLELDFGLYKYKLVFFGGEMGLLYPSSYGIKRDSSSQ